MTDRVTVKVSRQMFPQTYTGHVVDRHQGVNRTMFLDDVVRHAMGGEPVAWFEAEVDGQSVKIFQRVPKPEGWGNGE